MLNQMKKKVLYIYANILYGWAMSDYLPYDELKFLKKIN